MYGGKYLYFVLPMIAWGTHCWINKQAYQVVKKTATFFPGSFPTLRAINKNEEFSGPDGAWLKNTYSESNMVFNPETGQGNAPYEAERLFRQLASALKVGNLKNAAKEAAWLAHVLVDGLTPPHQIGEYKTTELWFFFWKIKNDWHDGGYIGSPWHKHDIHSKFEFRLIMSFWSRRRFAQSSLNKENVKSLLDNSITVAGYHIQHIRNIHSLNLFNRYRERGWTKELREDINTKLFPTIITVVATLWYTAWRNAYEAREMGRTYLTH